jgi:hypothetical protein
MSKEKISIKNLITKIFARRRCIWLKNLISKLFPDR